ncbi:MAG TPA: metabolite traffic protein EboE [Propionibacterium sp.]|nr:metabolite traffic protein EboE [Propionibacterium sp.]
MSRSHTPVGYCTNVHPAEDLPGLLDQLDVHAGPIRQRLGVPLLDVGLWLPAPVAAELAAGPDARALLKDRLAANGLAVRTLNAFPYAGFHADVVKRAVYLPRWGDPARTEFTLHCAEVLADLLPVDGVGSISTVPLGWREGWGPAEDAAAERELGRVGAFLEELYARSGRRVRLAIEPEPGCVLDTVADVVAWLRPRVESGSLDPAYIGICLDTCHLAVSFADPVTEIAAVHAAGLSVVKVQASAAPEVPDPSDPRQRELIGRFVEPRYLHQTRELAADGTVLGVDDLDVALTELPGGGPWRVHFHIPVHADPQPPLRSTRGTIVDCLRELAGAGAYDLEVETYTWAVLPPETAGVDLVTGITEELRWLMAAAREEE